MSLLATTDKDWQRSTHPGRALKARKRTRQKDSGRQGNRRPIGGAYRRIVSTSLDVRRDRLSKLVQRVVAHARREKQWTLNALLEEANVKKSVYYRWVNKDWTGDLDAGPLERFFDAAGWPVSEALDILWPGKYTKREATPPPPIRDDIALIARALEDPNTSPEDRAVIEMTLDLLLSRIAPQANKRKRAS